MKRVITFMMALALVLSMGITAFAAADNNGSIKITNATPGETYSVYKIFEATYDAEGHVTYTINEENQFFNKLFGENGTADEYFVYHAKTGVVTRAVDETGANIKTDAELFKYLAGLLEGATPDKSEPAESTELVIDELTTGYYVISRTNGTTNGVTITSVKPYAEVHDKNHLPGKLDKSNDKDSANVGDTINWELKVTASNYDDGAKVYNYTIWDKLSHEWAEIDTTGIKVFVNDVKIENWELVEDESVDFKIDIPWAELTEAGEFVRFYYDSVVELKVTYSGVVLDAAAAKDPNSAVNKNVADLEWDTENTPNVPGDGDETETDVFNLGFTKVDGTDSTKTLPGAIFELYIDADCTIPVYVRDLGKGVYIVDAVRDETDTNEVVTLDDGEIVVQGLAAGTYYLKETKAPEGYNKLDAVTPVVVGATNEEATNVDRMKVENEQPTYTANNANTDIANFSGVELPSTGGAGTMMMITFGTLVAIAFAVLLITQKKMSIYRD